MRQGGWHRKPDRRQVANVKEEKNMEKEVKELKLKVARVRECKTRDGRKFNAFSTVDKTGTLMDLKFVTGCHNVPTDRCWIYVDSDKVNVSRKTEYPTVWVKDVNRIEPLTSGRTNAEDYFQAADEADAGVDVTFDESSIPF